MCLACGLSSVRSDWTLAGFSADARSDTDRRLEDLASLLQHYGLTVSRPRFGAGYLVTSPTGCEARAASVDALWPAVLTLTGCIVDPLDPVFLARAET